ncbi:MAG: type II secretion system protein GspK [Phycisphaerae bacterium]
MKSSGSVLIVVLGLLAILAVIGITFITMSNLDRRTATNFAVQSQFILAADGAVDYVCTHLVQDLWAYNTMQTPEDQGMPVQRHEYYSTGFLLSDYNQPAALNVRDNVGLLRNEPFDHPGAQYDPWLSGTVGNTGSVLENHFSYGYQTSGRFSDVTDGPYGLRDWGTDTSDELRPNNLGFPASDGTVPRYTYDIAQGGRGHGVWIPDLSFPFEAGLIRVSVTVLDHGAMLNMNAHGNRNQGSERKGWYISDVDPSLLFTGGGAGQGMPNSFFSASGTVPGLWAQQDRPGNRNQLQVVIENPARYEDNPFTLDEEFELRRLTGTHFTSRLEHFVEEAFAGKLRSAPGTATTTPAVNRLHLTTVGWTAEVRPNQDRNRQSDEQAKPSLDGEGYQWRKVDLNLDDANDIREAIQYADFLDDDQDERQFVANICAFRDGRKRDDEDDDKELLHKYAGKWGASRQPVFEDLKVTFLDEKEVTDDDGNVEHILQRWELTVRVINPWRELYLRDAYDGLPVENLSVAMNQGTHVTRETDFGDVEPPGGGEWLLGGQRAEPLKAVIRREIPHPASPDEKKLSEAVKSISLKYRDLTIDRIDTKFIDQVSEGMAEGDVQTIERGILVDSPAGGGDDTDVRVAYIFLDDSEGAPKWFEEDEAPDQPPAGAVPIRFPKSVKVKSKDDVPVGGLPPEWIEQVSGGMGGDEEGVGFRAFRRVGDLNQVLCLFPRPGEDDENFWPWVPRVAESMGQEEQYVKFSWYARTEDAAGGGGGGGGAGDDDELRGRLSLANVFTVGGPWLDQIDNDGDGFADYRRPSSQSGGGQGTVTFAGRDTGMDFTGIEGGLAGEDQGGRFGGSEIRVAGKVNLNTAGRPVLEALGDSFGISNLDEAVRALRATRPIESPAAIVNEQRLGGTTAPSSMQGEEAKGPVERRDLAYTLISNIATVRSDTFSVYGTVQYVDLQAMHDAGTRVEERKAAVRRSRRFWALIDRSVSACHHPMAGSATGSFQRPRILNFQWMD